MLLSTSPTIFGKLYYAVRHSLNGGGAEVTFAVESAPGDAQILAGSVGEPNIANAFLPVVTATVILQPSGPTHCSPLRYRRSLLES